jgi:hypothetical protein
MFFINAHVFEKISKRAEANMTSSSSDQDKIARHRRFSEGVDEPKLLVDGFLVCGCDEIGEFVWTGDESSSRRLLRND